MSRETHRSALPADFTLHEYRIDKVIGHGGFGITYRAWDAQLEQWVAIKEYLPNELAVREGVSTVYAKSSTDEEAFDWGLQRFILEARTLAQFKHPNIVRVLRFFEAHRTAYMVMEYHDGESLSALLKRGALEEARMLEIVLPIMEGLQEVHDTGFLHRDIKPANILIRKEDGQPILLDFGAARFAIGQKSTSLTSIVTPGYAPFEQYDSKSEQGPWTDIYALGAVMYYAISGKAPNEVVGRLKRDDMPRAVELGNGKYQREILRAIDWALALDEDARPQTIQEWREAMLAPPLEILPQNQVNIQKTSQASQDRWYSMFIWALMTLVIGVPSSYLLVQEYQQPGSFNALLSGEMYTPIQQREVETLIGRYFASIEQADIELLLTFYSEWVDYYSWGSVRKSAIRDDKQGFFARWPKVRYTLASPVELFDTDKRNEKHIVFNLVYNAQNPNPKKDDKRISFGKARQEWRVRREPGGLKIIFERQTIYTRKHDPHE